MNKNPCKNSIKSIFSIVCFSLILSGCTTTPPDHRENICDVFYQYPHWYWNAQEVQKKWGLPINVLMAIMYQESRFEATAKPKREHLLWVIPWFRPSSAHGYSQALNQTWLNYKYATHNPGASRNNFHDASDFIGWYTNFASKKLGLSKSNTYAMYLAYHEGTGGYARGTYENQAWLKAVAQKVQRRAWIFKTQLMQCQAHLPQKPWWNFWG